MTEKLPAPHGGRSRRRSRRWRAVWMVAILAAILFLAFGSKGAYHWLKAKRAEQFAVDADQFADTQKWNDAAAKYRAALQLDPLNYRGLAGAARLASRFDRPEAAQLWEQVNKLPQCTVRDRQDYADFLLKSNGLDLAERTISSLLKNDPDAKTLLLAARYSRKIGESAKAVEFAKLAVKRVPNDAAARFQLAQLLAESTSPGDQAEARKVLWEIANTSNTYKKAAIEALARAPQLSTEERNKLLEALQPLVAKDVTDDLLAADIRMQLQPDNVSRVSRIYQETIDRWQGGNNEQVIQLARWLNAHQQPELVLSLFPID